MVPINLHFHADALRVGYVLVLTSNDREKTAVQQAFSLRRKVRDLPANDGAYLGYIGKTLVLHIAAQRGISEAKSPSRVYLALWEGGLLPKPLATLLVGFCWGNPTTVKNGDVILSDSFLSTNFKVASTNGYAPAKPRLVQSSLSIGEPLRAAIDHAAHQNNIAVRFGPVASEETLFQSAELRDSLLAAVPGVLGGEMEAFGIFDRATPWLIVKAVSDNGDEEMDQNDQDRAAKNACLILTEVIDGLIRQHGGLDYSGPAARVLSEMIYGDALTIDARTIAPDGLSDRLNNEIGPVLYRALERYCTPAAYSSQFVRSVTSFVLEMLQNAFRYGGANSGTIALNPSKIVVTYDGPAFDIRTLKGSRGGREALDTLRIIMESDSSIALDYTHSKGESCITISLGNALAALQAAKKDCAITVKLGEIDRRYGTALPLGYDPCCRSLYLDSRWILMPSRRMSLAKALEVPLSKGCHVYIACADQFGVDQALSDFEDSPYLSQLTVFVAS